MNDKWLRLIGIPAVAFIALGYFNPEAYSGSLLMFFIGLFMAFFHTIVIWQGNRYIHLRLRKRFPGYHNTTRRILWEIGLALIYTVVTTSLLTYLLKPPSDYQPHFFEADGILTCVYDSLIFTIMALVVFMTIYEARYFWVELKKNIKETEALARSHVETQLATLKKQLDPHFLFNSLNTLSALIDPENAQAQRYLEQLSDVYRYVLTTRDETTVPLDKELEFLNSYLYLNKVRFRNNLQVEQNIDSNASRFHIPVLSLQILVENAIKHNVISRERPLSIRIHQDGDFITVSNNKQIRPSIEKSTRIGLQNIINRYNLLTSTPVEIDNDTKAFTVKLPLLLQPNL